MEGSLKDIKPLAELKDALIVLRDSMTALTEEKVKHIANLKEEFEGMIATAQMMQAENIAISKMNKIREDLNSGKIKLAKETNDTINRYI